MTGIAPLWMPAYIALGSNLEQPVTQVRQAMLLLAQMPTTQAMLESALYRSAPMGPQDQPVYINAVVGLLTQLSPEALLQALQKIEQAMGKTRSSLRWGARIIDLDLLLYADLCLHTPPLQLPHPGLLARNFVIQPLADIAPQLSLPNGITAANWARHLGHQGLECMASA